LRLWQADFAMVNGGANQVRPCLFFAAVGLLETARVMYVFGLGSIRSTVPFSVRYHLSKA
jgi:hypothetical protein